MVAPYDNFFSYIKKIPHTGDTESLDGCGSSDRYFFGVGWEGDIKNVTHDNSQVQSGTTPCF